MPEKSSNVDLNIQINSKKRRISEVLAISAIILLSIDTAHTFVSDGKYGFLPLLYKAEMTKKEGEEAKHSV